jgi:hypothetical protein
MCWRRRGGGGKGETHLFSRRRLKQVMGRKPQVRSSEIVDEATEPTANKRFVNLFVLRLRGRKDCCVPPPRPDHSFLHGLVCS